MESEERKGVREGRRREREREGERGGERERERERYSNYNKVFVTIHAVVFKIPMFFVACWLTL